jgi:hypothetical protein
VRRLALQRPLRVGPLPSLSLEGASSSELPSRSVEGLGDEEDGF